MPCSLNIETARSLESSVATRGRSDAASAAADAASSSPGPIATASTLAPKARPGRTVVAAPTNTRARSDPPPERRAATNQAIGLWERNPSSPGYACGRVRTAGGGNGSPVESFAEAWQTCGQQPHVMVAEMQSDHIQLRHRFSSSKVPAGVRLELRITGPHRVARRHPPWEPSPLPDVRGAVQSGPGPGQDTRVRNYDAHR